MDFQPTAAVEEEDLQTTYNNSIVRAAALQRPPGVGGEFDLDTAKSAESAVVTDSGYNGCSLPDDVATLQCDTISTNCVADGLTATCECKTDYYSTGSLTLCEEQFCTADTDCNNGICDKESDTIYSCKCNWGFSGLRCQNAWLLIVVIVAAVVAIVLVVGIFLCCRSRTKKEDKEVFDMPSKGGSPSESPPASVQYKSYSNPALDEPIYATTIDISKSDMEKPPLDDNSSMESGELRARL